MIYFLLLPFEKWYEALEPFLISKEIYEVNDLIMAGTVFILRFCYINIVGVDQAEVILLKWKPRQGLE